MEDQKLINALNMIVKAQAFVYGQRMVEMLAKKKIFVVISCTDMGISVKKKLVDKTNFYQVKLIQSTLTVEKLTKIIHHQSNVSAVGITDPNLAKLLINSAK